MQDDIDYLKREIQRLKVISDYAVGDLYITTSEIDPSIKYGGTWERFGAGRVLVGYDASDVDFDSVEETGGHKEMQQHNHSITDPGHNHHLSELNIADTGSGTKPVGKWDGTFARDTDTQGTGITIDNEGSGDSGNLQPYVVVYIWKRTA